MKTKLPLTAFLLLFCIFCFAGKSEKTEPDKSFKRVYFGISVTPNVAFRYVKPNSSNSSGYSAAQVQDAVNSKNHYEIPGPGVAAGLKLGVRLTHFLSIESGALITLDQYRYKSTSYIQPVVVWTPVPGAPPDSFRSTIDYTYLYFNIPLALNFTMGHRKVRGIASLGTTFDFILQAKAHNTKTLASGAETTSQTTVNTHDFRSFNLSPFVGIGIDCYLSKAVVLRVMPQAQIQAFKNINTPLTEYLWNAGLNVSLLLGFLEKK